MVWFFGAKCTFLGTKLQFLSIICTFWSHFFCKNFIFRVKTKKYFVFSGPNVHFWVQNYSYYPKFVHFSKIFRQKLHFLCKNSNFLFFRTKCTFLGTKLQFLSKICTFWSNFWAKTSFLE